jgi:hypothetical protein
MPIIFEHPELREPLTFDSTEALIEWAGRERDFWSQIKTSGSHSVEVYTRTAQTQLQRVIEAATSGDANALQTTLASFAGQVPHLSTGPRGQLLDALRRIGRDPKTITATLAAFLKPDEVRQLLRNDHWVFDCALALGYVAAADVAGDSQRLVEFFRTIEKHQTAWSKELDSLRSATTASQRSHEEVLEQMRTSVSQGQERVAKAVSDFEEQIENVRKKFEEQFALRTPMKYWSDKAERHQLAATRYRWWFSALLVGGAAGLIALGTWWLLPLLRVQADAYWSLILFSVAIAIWAWPLRLTSKLYLTHQHLFEDALEREVIVKSFLALGEQVELTDGDRQLLLGALVRHAPISLGTDDTGFNVTDAVMARTITKS